MDLSPQEIEAGAMDLPPSERAHLARRLIQSLDEEVEDPTEVERAWEAEIQRRLNEYRADNVQTAPAADVLSEARCRLR
jgi:putative addiction module component (TIGR02574 family)